jgi:hypothetical protein
MDQPLGGALGGDPLGHKKSAALRSVALVSIHDPAPGTSGNIVLPTTYAEYHCIAYLEGGGASGGSGFSPSNAGSGGGGGAAAIKQFRAKAGQVLPYAVGDGGALTSGGPPGNDGGDTTLTIGSATVTAGGGKRGLSTNLDPGGAGGIATGGDLNRNGGRGGAGGSSFNTGGGAGVAGDQGGTGAAGSSGQGGGGGAAGFTDLPSFFAVGNGSAANASVAQPGYGGGTGGGASGASKAGYGRLILCVTRIV